MTRPDHHGDPPDALRDELDDLAARATGVRFIYDALDAVARVHQLTDAVLVLPTTEGPDQIFRLGRRPVSPQLAARLGSNPGLYCDPPTVSAAVGRDLVERCRLAVTARLQPAPAHLTTRVTAASVRALEHLRHDPRGPVDLYGADTPAAANTIRPKAKRIVSMLLAALDLVALALALGGAGGSLRFVVGLAFGLTVPGWAVVGLFDLPGVALEAALSLVTSFSIVMIAAQILMTAHAWHLVGFEDVLALVCLPSLLFQSRPPRRHAG